MDLLPNIQVDLLQEDPEPLEEENVSDGEGEPELVVKEILEEDIPEVQERSIIPEEDIFVEKKPKKAPPQKKEKKKRVMSEKQKEALAKGRAKRAANKKAQKKEAPLPEAVAPVTKQYIQENNSATASNGMTDEKLQELIFQGVSQYDSLRKKRKAEKRESQAKQQHDNKVFNDINSALNRTSDPWASAFNF